MSARAGALTALGSAACVALLLSGVAHPALAPACLVAILFKRTVLDPLRFELPDLLFVLSHALLFLIFVWFVLFHAIGSDDLAILLGFATFWMVLRSFARDTPYNRFLIFLASLVIVVGSVAAAPGLMPLVITGLYLVTACHAVPVIMASDARPDAAVRVRVLGRVGRWSVAYGFAIHHLSLAALIVGAMIYLAVPRLAHPKPGVASTDGEELPRRRRERHGVRGTGVPSGLVTGFPESVRIGDIGTIKRSTRWAFDAWVRLRGVAHDPGPAEGNMLLLRAGAWDTYSTRTRSWSHRSVGRRELNRRGEIRSGPAPVDWTVRMHGYDGRALFLPPRARRIRSAVGPLYLDLLGRVTSPQRLREYGVEAALVVTDLRALRPAPGRGRLLTVPSELERALRPYANAVARGARSLPQAGSVLAAAQAIRAFFRTRGFRYTLDLPPGLPPGQDPMIAFLDRREGHCELYASTACFFLRMMGIPARLAGGVRCSQRMSRGHYRAFFSNAHAWVEIPCQGKGFVAFDFTPADGLAVESARASAGSADGEAAAEGVSGTGAQGPIDWNDPFRYGRAEQKRLLRFVRDRLDGLLLSLCALAFVLLAAWALVRHPKRLRPDRLRVTAPRGVSRRSLGFYLHWLRRCAAQGHRRLPWQTPREFLAGLPAALREQGRALTADFESRRYGSNG